MKLLVQVSNVVLLLFSAATICHAADVQTVRLSATEPKGEIVIVVGGREEV